MAKESYTNFKKAANAKRYMRLLHAIYVINLISKMKTKTYLV